MIGTTLGKYRIVEKLGDGGMGAVYRASDEMLGREVAIKVLRPELARQAALMERFRAEAMALARFNHPNIAILHDLERSGDELYMVMEFVRGETLEQLVQRSGRLTWHRAAEIMASVLEALDHAHDQGVVHRDIKPANIMITRTGVVKVMDFGIARMMGRSRQTRSGHAVGTPTYMSPEQLRGEDVDGRTDLYAVGAVLFELATGRIAFDADSDYQLMMQQLHEPPPRPSTIVNDVPDSIDRIVLRAMEKKRDDRFTSAAAFRVALLDAVRHGGDVAEPRVERGVVPVTRLAADVVSSPGIAPTRLAPDAGHAVPPTRLGTPETVASSGTRARPAHDWSRDWRTYVVLASLFVSAGFVAMNLRRPTEETRDQSQVGTPAADTSVLVAASPAVSSEVSSGTADAPVGVAPPVTTAPPAEGRFSRLSPVPPGAKGPGGTSEKAPVTPRPVVDSAPPRTEVKPETPPPPAPPRAEERVVSPSEGVTSALRDFASSVAGREAAAVDRVLRGPDATRDQFLTLLRDGRLSFSVPAAVTPNVDGNRATMSFTTTVSLRTPFGANRRKDVSFEAQFARSGSAWRLVELRILQPVELK